MSKSSTMSRKLSAFDMKTMGGSQMQGFLLKKPVGHKTTSWTRRYFVLKEGFLLYYAEAEKKTFEERSTFNIHPKGIIPLSYCVIEEMAFPSVTFGININFSDGSNAISLGADDDTTRKMWIKKIEEAADLTVENYSLSKTLIATLEKQNLELAREKHEYYLKYTEEAKEVGMERQHRMELEEFNQQLEEEKQRIDLLVDQLVEAHEEIKQELSEANQACEMLQEDREHLKESTATLKQSIIEVTNERNEIIKRLREESLEEESNNEAATKLREELDEITQAAKGLEAEKLRIETELLETENKWQEFIKEKEQIATEANELKLEIASVTKEKVIAEAVLKDEIAIRLKLQDEFEEGKKALIRLETDANKAYEKLKSLGIDSSDSIQFNSDVKSLKEFFESMSHSMESINMASVRRNRTFSRRYTQIKKLRSARSTRRGKPKKPVRQQQNSTNHQKTALNSVEENSSEMKKPEEN